MLSNLSVDRFLTDKPLALTLAGLEELRGHIEARLAVFDAGPRAFIESVRASRSSNVHEPPMRDAELSAPAGGAPASALRQTKAQRVRQEAVAAPDRASPSRGRPRSGATGVIQIRGVISQHEQDDLSSFLFGGASTEAISRQLREFMADEQVGSIVLDIDSPGGTVAGVAELATEIRNSRGQKPIVAVSNSMAASAAYWIGSAADQFYITPGGLVGSVGVYALHIDVSESNAKEGVRPTFISAGKYKVEGNPFEPLADETKVYYQSLVDDTYEQFIQAVAQGRGVSAALVRDGYGQGRVLTAKQAKSAGMVDGIYTFEQAIAKAATLRPASTANGQAAATATELDLEAAANETSPPQTDEEGTKRLGRMRLRSIKARAAAGAA